jgi:hypothetical protein
VVEEGEHPVRDGVAGGLVARHGQHQHEEAELVVGQVVPVDLGGDELGDDVVAGAGPPLLGHGQAVAEDLGGRDHAVVVVRGPLVVADHPVRPGEDLAPVLLRHAEQLADRLQRQLHRDVGDEVSGAGLERRGHDAPGAFVQGLAQVADGPGGEAAGDDAAQLGVFGRVHVEQDDPLHLDGLAGHALLKADQRGVLPGRVDSGVLETDWMSACRVTAQYPSSSNPAEPRRCVTHQTGAARRSSASSRAGTRVV